MKDPLLRLSVLSSHSLERLSDRLMKTPAFQGFCHPWRSELDQKLLLIPSIFVPPTSRYRNLIFSVPKSPQPVQTAHQPTINLLDTHND